LLSVIGGSTVTPLRALAILGLALSLDRTLAQETPPPPPQTPPPAEGAPAAPAAPANVDPAVAAARQQARDAFKKGSWQEAGDAARTVLASVPKDLESLYIAGASERQTGKIADAETHLRTLVEASPIFPLAHFQLAYVLFIEGEGLMRQAKPEDAKAHYVEAAAEFTKELERNPTHTASLSSRSIALARAGQIDESVTAHEAWIAAVPQKNDPVVSLAATLAGAGRSTEAMAALERLPDKAPQAVQDATVAAANVFIGKKDWAAAAPFLEKAAQTNPSSTKVRSLLTEAYARASLPDDAVKSLGVLLTMEPTPDEAESVGEAIKVGIGNGKDAPPPMSGVSSAAALRIPAPRHPKNQDSGIETEVLVLTRVKADSLVGETVLVPNRIWKDIRTSGFEAAAFDAVKRGKFLAGTKDGQPVDLWLVVPVKFSKM
jgi:tetratricopeptide (TPR) repeat protein